MPHDIPRPLFLRIDKPIKSGTKYIPYQGKREKARRLKQLTKETR